jgi:ribose-phosphate pyrophosphokinase
VNTVALALPGSQSFASRVSSLGAIPLGVVETRRFPDRETYLRIDTDCAGKNVVLVCTLDRPDDKLLPLVFLADLARELGASSVGLVAPYLAYLRQDQRFQTGEALTSRTFAALLSRYVDWLVTIDPHLHRYDSLSDVYAVPSRVVHAAPALAEWIAQHIHQPLVVGPDEESAQWVEDVAGRAHAPWVVMRKTRLGDRRVEISAPDVDSYRQCTPVVVDDIISSAQTMAETVRQLLAARLPPPVCLGVHALFSETAEQSLREAGAAEVVTTNSVPHDTSRIDIAPLLIPAIHDLAG